MTLCIKRLLGGFHHRVAQMLSGNLPQRRSDGMWEYHPLGDAMVEAGIEDIES